MLHLDDHGKNPANYRNRKWLIGLSALGVIGVILDVSLYMINLGSSPSGSVSSTYLSNTVKLMPIAPSGAAGQQSNNGQEVKHIVPLDQIVSGGPPPDGIPSIDNPKFLSVADANKFLKDSDLVLGITINGQTKAYPLLILVWHEIVNDKVGGVPVAVTYCPLCFTTPVFNRTISGNVVEFGTSGKLYNNNLVMYDRLESSKIINDKVGNKSIVLFSLYPRMVRTYVPIIHDQTLDFQYNASTNKILDKQTGSEWNFDGIAINGQMKGKQLTRLPFDEGFWFEWSAFHPQTRIYPG